MSEFQIIETADSSPSIYSTDYHSSYHSKHGAVQESQHVYIENGLCFAANFKKEIKLFEMGFGTGLNAWLTLQKGSDLNLNIRYTSLEKHPLPKAIFETLHYPTLAKKVSPELFAQMHLLEWEREHEINEHFSMLKIQANIEEWEPHTSFDLVYYDAFGPETQPELWDERMMEKLASCMSSKGILVTFCAKGSFRRALKAAGFEVEKLPGPPGKREMTRAILK